MEKARLLQAIETALQDLQTEGIDGWGIYPPDEHFKRVQTGGKYGCRTENCSHSSHGAYAADYCLLPTSGTLSRLGQDGDDEYYALTLPGATIRLYRVWHPAHHHDQIDGIVPEQVPAYLLANLAG